MNFSDEPDDYVMPKLTKE